MNLYLPIIFLVLFFNSESFFAQQSTQEQPLLLVKVKIEDGVKRRIKNTENDSSILFSYHIIKSPIIDSSRYFDLVDVFFYDGEMDTNTTSSMLFWNEEKTVFVDSFPFSHGDLSISTIIDDTTLVFKWKNEEVRLYSSQIFQDTLYLSDNQKSQDNLQFKIITIKNLGLIQRNHILDRTNWEEKKFEFYLDGYHFPDEEAIFEGGPSAMLMYFVKNIVFDNPYEDFSEISTRFFAKLIINEFGNVTRVDIIQNFHPSMDEQMIELFKNMPRWEPAKIDGKPVPSRIFVPININLD